jgi:dienelactone hydrolase
MRRRVLAWLTVVAGAVLLSAGVGIALPHLVKRGPLLRSAAGLVLMVGGLALLWSGSNRLLRPFGWRRLPAVLAIASTLAVGLLVISQAVAATNVPRTGLGSATPADRGLTYRDVTFPTRDGVRLSGWYVPSRSGAAVALLHGAGSTRSSVLDHAVVLDRHGYGVLLFDARGHGRSGGRAMDFGWYGDEDVAAAVTYLARRPDVDPARIGAVGLSMGGEEAIGAAGSDRRIRAVVAEGATGRTAADKAWLSDVYGWRGCLQEGVEHLTYGLTDLLTGAAPPASLRASVAAAAPRSVLLIAAGDVPDEAHAGRYIRGGSPTSVELWVVPGAGHTGGLARAPAAWTRRVTTFLDTALAGG